MNDPYLVLGGILLAILVLLTFLLLDRGETMSTRKVARLGVLLALALILGLLESLLPPFLLPGMRLGLANIMILIILGAYGGKDAILISVLKALLVSLLRGSFLSMGGWMALAGSLLSALGMVILHALWKKGSYFIVSVFGALLHVFAQLCVAYIYLGVGVWGYAPYLLLASFVSGLFIGLIATILLRRNHVLAYLKSD